MVIKIHLSVENDSKRFQCPEDGEGDVDNETDDELDFFGIVVEKPKPPTCPYDKNGKYIPRNRRR